MFGIKKENRDVAFLDKEGFRLLISPLSAQALEIFDNLIDRYVDYEMREHVKNKINGENVDEDLELKLRWVLEFKAFFNKMSWK